MTLDPHEHARLLIALSGPEEVSNAEQSWLALHLESCAACREFAESARRAIGSLRAIPIVASASLVSSTQARVRQRARELARRQERLRVIWVCCAAVTLCAATYTMVLWQGFAWLSQQWGQPGLLSKPAWEIGFVALGLMPAVVVGILLLAQGTYLAEHNGSWRG